MQVLIFGATSAIATATARQLVVESDCEFFLVGRSAERLSALAADLKVRGADSAETYSLDLCDVDKQGDAIEAALAHLGHLDVVLICHGILGDQASDQLSVDDTLKALHTNALSYITLMTAIANVLEERKSGTLAVISSVAGDRGRRSNYIYGSAKAMVTTFASGLRNRLHDQGVHVMTVKPGLVDTPMTEGFTKGMLWAQPETVGRGIVRGIVKRKDVVYVPGFWRVIMLIITHVPEFLFKRLNL